MDQQVQTANIGKFLDPMRTADGAERARVALTNPQTLWFNTGTLCNITCVNCYIESSPQNDRLAYLSAEDVRGFLDQIRERAWPVREIGFTGGEPFLNREFPAMMRDALSAGFRVLVLTNAMRPMMRPLVKAPLAQLIKGFGDRLTLRVSLDHWTEAGHDAVRGKGSFASSLEGLRWLRDQGARITVAGRARWGESEEVARSAYGELFRDQGLKIDPDNPEETVIFPEMDLSVEVPEITTACWGILGKNPDSVMCSSARMVVKRRGAAGPSVLACTLLPYDPQFELGETLAEAERDVALNHPHCAKFCVLGGASCSA